MILHSRLISLTTEEMAQLTALEAERDEELHLQVTPVPKARGGGFSFFIWTGAAGWATRSEANTLAGAIEKFNAARIA